MSSKTYTYTLALLASVILITGLQPVSALTEETIMSALQNSGEYHVVDIVVPNYQEEMVKETNNLLNVIEQTTDPEQKAFLQNYMDTYFLPLVATYGIFLESNPNSSMIPEQDRHRNVERGTIQYSKAFQAAFWVTYNCDAGLLKCTTQKVYKKLNMGDQFAPNGVIGNTPYGPNIVGNPDLEFHFEVTNISGNDMRRVQAEAWGTIKDYSRQMSETCADASSQVPYIYRDSTWRSGETHDIRYCETDNIQYGDRINADLIMNYYRR